MPVAILGTNNFDATQIDPTSVTLEGVAATTSTISDVATPYTPFVGKIGQNACTTGGPDGYKDLVMHFDATQLSAALGNVTNRQAVTLHLNGNFLPQFGGAPITGEDIVVIIKNK